MLVACALLWGLRTGLIRGGVDGVNGGGSIVVGFLWDWDILRVYWVKVYTGFWRCIIHYI